MVSHHTVRPSHRTAPAPKYGCSKPRERVPCYTGVTWSPTVWPVIPYCGQLTTDLLFRCIGGKKKPRRGYHRHKIRVRVIGYRLRFGFGFGLGSGGWSGPTCAVETDVARPAQGLCAGRSCTQAGAGFTSQLLIILIGNIFKTRRKRGLGVRKI